MLPSRVPDSGTAGRVDAGGEGVTAYLRRAARNLRNAPLYAPGTQNALNAALLDRPAAAVAVGDRLLRSERPLGMFARPASLFYGPFAVSADY